MARLLLIVRLIVSVFCHISWGSALHDDSCTSGLGVMGGQNVTIKDLSFAASIHLRRNGDKPFCGGALVHEQFILTAAYCISGLEAKDIAVRVGSDYSNIGGALLQVQTVITHKDFDEKTTANNIALLKLRYSVLFGWLARAELPSKDFEIKEGKQANITGWGGRNISEIWTIDLHQVTLPIKPQNCCTEIDGKTPLNDTTKICAGSPGHDACQGDGGSPLTLDRVLIGLNSYGENESCGKKPSVYTRISSYLDWISSTISKNL